MSWRDLLQQPNEAIVLPWTGGRDLRSRDRQWRINGKLPAEHGWYRFVFTSTRYATTDGVKVDAEPALLGWSRTGYLVGDRFATDDFIQRVVINPDESGLRLPRVHLIDEGLERFAHVSVGTIYNGGPLIFRAVEFPRGAEDAVQQAFENGATSVDDIKGVTPALDGAFRMAVFQREQAEKRRVDLEKRRVEEEAKRALEARRREIVERLGDGAGRRALAKEDFGAAATAALAVGGATLLDWKKVRGEYVVKYRLLGRRFECVCDQLLQIIDAGICLVDHATGKRYDTEFTLESLPGVVRTADEIGKLVVFRHV